MAGSLTARVGRYRNYVWLWWPEQATAAEPEAPKSAWPLTPHQEPPPHDDWDTWVTLGGRGSGKTFLGARYVLDHLRQLGPKARVAVAAPTLVDVRDVCAEGETGLITIAPAEFPTYHRSIGYCEARHIGGGYVRFMGSEEPKRWNGPQWSLGWWDEWPLCNLLSYREYQFGLRLGDWPRTVITATPKAIAKVELEALLKRPGVFARTEIRTDDNTHLSERRRAELHRDFDGTTLGLAELEGQLVFDTEGALWKHEWLERARVPSAPPLARVVVAIDPAGGNGNQSAQTGICVAGLGMDGDYYVIELEGAQLPPDLWLDHAIALGKRHDADALVAEMNYGGPFIRRMVEQIPRDEQLAFHEVYATRGKVVRAEPIAQLDAKGRIHHVGLFADGEAQLCSFPLTKRKDMTDARVWAITALMNGPLGGSMTAAQAALERAAARQADPQRADDRRPLVELRW